VIQAKGLKDLVVYKLKSHLSTDNISRLRLFYRSFTSPQYFKSHVNNYRYTNSLYKSSTVDNFVAPVFTVSLNDSCNLRCPNCSYVLIDPDKFFNSHMAPAKFRETLERYNKNKSSETIFLGGGEPLMHPQFEELIDICKEYNFRFIRMSTNGILVRKKISSIGKLDSINISMDSYDSDSFYKYRKGTPKQFDQIIDGLEALNEKGIKFSLSYIVTKENLHTVPKMIDFSEKMKANLVHFHNINPHGSDQFTSLMIQDDDTTQFLNTILERTDYPFDITLPVIFDPQSPSFGETGCSQPWSHLLYNSLGNVAYCCHLDQDKEIGNVFEGYDRNSPKMKDFREDVINGKQAEKTSCTFCQRRFAGKEFGNFSTSQQRWLINEI
jgi:MoaA/NifB/PqqE/SkfB family radical SAM enzyme